MRPFRRTVYSCRKGCWACEIECGRPQSWSRVRLSDSSRPSSVWGSQRRVSMRQSETKTRLRGSAGLRCKPDSDAIMTNLFHTIKSCRQNRLQTDKGTATVNMGKKAQGTEHSNISTRWRKGDTMRKMWCAYMCWTHTIKTPDIWSVALEGRLENWKTAIIPCIETPQLTLTSQRQTVFSNTNRLSLFSYCVSAIKSGMTSQTVGFPFEATLFSVCLSDVNFV